jgi:transposase-like protein
MVMARWSLHYGLSYRDVEELLADRNIEVDHVTGGCVARSWGRRDR